MIDHNIAYSLIYFIILLGTFSSKKRNELSSNWLLRTYINHTLFWISGNSKPTHPHGHGHSTIKDLAGSILGDDKSKDDGELWSTVEAQTAFLGPNLWDKTYETDLKVSFFDFTKLLIRQLNFSYICFQICSKIQFNVVRSLANDNHIHTQRIVG